MLQELANDGIRTLNDQSPAGTCTAIVVGLPRSGTSMIAAVLSQLGVHMGATANNIVFEDVEVADAIEKNPSELPHLIERNNAAHARWGFKRPMAFTSIGPHLAKFREPRIIVPFRDPLAVARREEVSMNSSFTGSLHQSAKLTLDLVEFITRTSAPIMLVSYEKALSDPMALVLAIRTFVGTTAHYALDQMAASAVERSPEAYVEASQVRFPSIAHSANAKAEARR